MKVADVRRNLVADSWTATHRESNIADACTDAATDGRTARKKIMFFGIASLAAADRAEA